MSGALREPAEVAVIGAGIAGLAAARVLRAGGLAPLVLDKGRGPGGRTSLRRAPPFAFDHGAQYFTARDPRLRAELAGWLERGVVARWEGRVVALGAGAARETAGETERFVGVPGMSAMAKELARGLELRCELRVGAVEHRDGRWLLRDEAGLELGCFERLVVTAPPAQAAALLDGVSPLAERAAAIPMRPCLAVMLGLEERYEVPFDGAFGGVTSDRASSRGDALAWCARDSSKPGRPRHEAWVLHAAPGWSAERFEAPLEETIDALARELERLSGVALPRVVHAAAHRWRFALPDPGLELGCLFDAERRLALAGDAYAGGRVEGAYLSGLAAAEALLAER